ncbi:MAG TPA: hypothetical protein VFG35_31390, partial [Actinoplanes sp.]|nr:hypothetical protein [Actinoplanes sp.]
VNLVCSLDKTGDVHLERKALPTMRDELIELFDRSELAKYMTEDELSRASAEAHIPGARTDAQSKTEAK